MAAEILVRPLHTLAEFRRCVEIAREVWGDSDLDTEPYVTLVIADHTGGQVLGAFDGDFMVGFTKAYVGLHDRTPYLHSHMTGVLPSHRDRRVGRYLKLFQREDALRRGIRLVEWTFDPLETKNAHFNINRLGAICRRYIPNFYGITTSPLHRGLPTDRLLVEWHLDTKRVVAAVSDLTPEPRDCPAHVHLPAPAAIRNAVSPGRPSEAVAQGKSASPTDFPDVTSNLQAATPSATTSRSEIQSRIRAEFTEWFSKGYAVLDVRSTLSGVDYCLAPYSDF
jgi:predicted GNAT superfamily acetyltransferase